MQKDVVKVNNQELAIKEFNGQRVITFKDIDLVHERPDGTARKRFSDNRKHFVEGEDFFKITPSEFRTAIGEMDLRQQNEITLITEQGYLMLVKSFTDDLAWEVQRKLVSFYFKKPQVLSPVEQLRLQGQAILEVNEKVEHVETRVDKLEFDIPLYGCESDELAAHVKRKGVAVLGGKQSEAYKDTGIRSKVYRNIYDQIKREFGIYDNAGHYRSYKALKRKYIYDAHELVDCYEPPVYLRELIAEANAQMSMQVAS